MDKIEDICCLLTGMLHLKDASGYVWGKLEEGTTWLFNPETDIYDSGIMDRMTEELKCIRA